MLYNNLLIDLNNLYWRCVCSNVKNVMQTQNKKDLYTQIIYESLQRIKTLKENHAQKDAQIFLLVDNPFSKINERQQVLATYKHARKNENIPPIFYKFLEQFIEILKIYDSNYRIVYCDGYEADDLVLPVVRVVMGKSLLISNDMDWARGIYDDTHWFNYVKVYTRDIFKNEYGFYPDNGGVKLYKTIHGDTSDNIPNAIPNLPTKVLLHIVDNYNSLDELFSNMWKDDIIPQQWKVKFKEQEKTLRINYQLVDYIDVDLSFDEICYWCKENLKQLKFWFDYIGLPYDSKLLVNNANTDKFFIPKRIKRLVKKS